ncbi:hypothetical protein JL722_9320 [Aureococcus anophagefferens]|nr:hypothetical protein JL722_9320 [Aureococcus anophagefferens]
MVARFILEECHAYEKNRHSAYAVHLDVAHHDTSLDTLADGQAARELEYHAVAATLVPRFIGIPKLKVRWCRCLVQLHVMRCVGRFRHARLSAAGDPKDTNSGPGDDVGPT